VLVPPDGPELAPLLDHGVEEGAREHLQSNSLRIFNMDFNRVSIG
jgi:hypothetical protein